MARIQVYPPDYVITPNDWVIGTDGDDFKKTKNFPVVAMLAYLGTNFNLQSADLIYNYSIGDENTLLDGQFTSNNRLDLPPLFSDITTLYISKTTVFGKLIDDYIQTVSDEMYSFMIYDFGDYNKFGFYSIVSAVSLNADTFTVVVTYNSGSGFLIDGLSYGLKVYPPSGGGGDNLGDHTATTTLNMADQNISAVGNIFRTTLFAPSIGQATSNGSFFQGYFERLGHRTTDGEYWILGTATTSQKLGWAKVVNPAGGASLIYTLDPSGAPIQSTDLVTKGYGDANYTGAARSAWVNELAQTAPTNVGAGLGDIEVGASLTLPTDTQTGDMFHVYYTVSWSPRNGKSIDDNNISVLTMETSFAGDVFDRATNPLLSLSGNISMDVHIIYTVLDATNGDFSQVTTVKMMDFITTSSKYVNIDVNSVSGLGDMTSGTFVIHATMRYADDLVSEGIMTRSQATIVRVNNG